MKKLYVTNDCKECNEIKDWIKEQENQIELDEIIELKKIDNKMMMPVDNGYEEINENVRAFPALEIGDDNGSSFLMGKEGCQKYLDKGFIHDVKVCPYLNKSCIEEKCEKFVILTTRYIAEGGCSDYMSTKLLTQMISKLNVRG